MSDKEKLSKPSYEQMPNGFKIKGLDSYKANKVCPQIFAYEMNQDEIKMTSTGPKSTDNPNPQSQSTTSTSTTTRSVRSTGSTLNENIKIRTENIRKQNRKIAATPIERRTAQGYKRYIEKMHKNILDSIVINDITGEIEIGTNNSVSIAGQNLVKRSKYVTVTSVKGNSNMTFSDPVAGIIMNRNEFVQAIRDKLYRNYHIRRINNIEVPVSNPDGDGGNNLG